MRSSKTRGFTLVELIVALTVFMIACAIMLVGIQPSLRAARVGTAYNLTVNVLRQARDISVAQRQTYTVTFNHIGNPATPDNLVLTNALTGTVINTYTLPTDVYFMVLAGFPTSPVNFPTTPDGFGVGATAIDFDQGVAGGVQNVVYFLPDGSAQDAIGNINNGVAYIARPGDYYSARAVTIWGATGRLRGWRMDRAPVGAAYYWRQM
jgi:type II secretory pathway pseudopilin PulG